MTDSQKLPSFITRDLGDSPEDDAEMQRRWEIYEREMTALIATGRLHQDADGWWIETATGTLIGPDLDDDRPRTDEELAQFRPFAEVLPELAESIRRARGRPRLDNPRKLVSLRLDPHVLEKFRATGPGWQTRINEALRAAVLPETRKHES